jgi:rhamnosyltransferase
MKIFVIIPVLNPSKWLFDNLIKVLSTQNINLKIVLINSGDKIPFGDCEIVNIDKKEFNHANTRNIALSYESDFYLFMTQDATPFDEYLIENLLKPFNDEDVVVSYARQIPYENAHITERFARNKNYPSESIIKSKEDISTLGIKTFFSSDSCAMYRGSYFKKVGGFKRDLNVSEDMEFAYRAIMDNKKVAYRAEARVYHSHVYNVFSLYKRYIAIGRFFKENPEIEKSISDIKAKATEKAGLHQALEELSYIFKHEPSAIFKSVLYNATKFVAFKRGKKLQ